jgi:hypothetical protein
MNSFGLKQAQPGAVEINKHLHHMVAPSTNHNNNNSMNFNNGGESKADEKDSNASLPDELADLGQRPEYTDRNGQHHPIAEFLYQLTKMLTDDNSEIIEWLDGRIKVHYPERLEGEVLHKYFRHSKFASFQRQLNYFGFRKIAGKGKMAPCSYVNDGATSDIRSLLLIKRKTNGSAARKAAIQQRAANLATGINPALTGMNFSALSGASGQPMVNNQAFTNAMQQLLSENALRASFGQMQQQNQGQQGNGNGGLSAQQTINLLALQQQQQQHQNQQMSMQQQLQQQQNQQHQQFQQHQQDFQQRDTMNSSGHGNNTAVSTNQNQTLEQLHATLAASMNQQKPLNASSLNASAHNSMNPGTAALHNMQNGGGGGGQDNPASAALKAQSNPATAAMDAASASSHANGFESSANLKSLLNQNGGVNLVPSFNGSSQVGNNGFHNQNVMNRLPSANTIFPENMSTASFGNLLGSSNRLSSLLSLNSFLGSREPSMADFAVLNPSMSAAQFAAASGVSAQMQAEVQKYNRSS